MEDEKASLERAVRELASLNAKLAARVAANAVGALDARAVGLDFGALVPKLGAGPGKEKASRKGKKGGKARGGGGGERREGSRGIEVVFPGSLAAAAGRGGGASRVRAAGRRDDDGDDADDDDDGLESSPRRRSTRLEPRRHPSEADTGPAPSPSARPAPAAVVRRPTPRGRPPRRRRRPPPRRRRSKGAVPAEG